MYESLNAVGTIPDDKDELMISVKNGSNTSREAFNSHDGIGSNSQDFDAFSRITLRTASSLTKESSEKVLLQVSEASTLGLGN